MTPLQKFLTITDLHFSGVNPGAYIGSYKQDILSALAECAELARLHNCDAVLMPGDITHSHIMSTAVLTELVEALMRFPCPVLTIKGNHDSETTNIGDIKGSPYGLLMAAGIIRDVYFSPWVGRRVVITGHPHDDKTDQGIEQYCRPEGFAVGAGHRGSGVHIHLTHGMLIPERPWWIKEGQDGDDIRYTIFDQLIADVPEPGFLPDVIVNGHCHAGHGAAYLPNGTLIVNYGAVCRLSRTLEEINRILRVGLITVEGPGRFQAMDIALKSQRPGHECLDREGLLREVERRKDREKVGEYLSLLGTKREVRTRDARQVIVQTVAEMEGAGKVPLGVAAGVLAERCLDRLNRVSKAMESD